MSAGKSEAPERARPLAKGAEELHPPRAFGRFRLLSRLGHGGTATVFVALEPAHEGTRLVVLKRLHEHLSEDAAARETFLDEARLAVSLEHPCIVRTHDFGTVDGRPFLTMESLAGVDLGHVFAQTFARGERVPVPIAARIVRELLRALEYAHERVDPRGHPAPIVHRDVSPHNLFVTFDGDVKLLDFGIAKSNLRSERTTSGVVKGKLGYMAPEQVTGERVDSRADLWAVGVVLWEALAGKRMLEASSEFATLTVSVSGPLPSLRDVVDVPPALADVCERALERNVWSRFQRAREMREALETAVGTELASASELAGYMHDHFLDELAAEQRRSAELAGATRRVTERPQRMRHRALGSAAAMLALCAVLAWWLTRSAPDAPLARVPAGPTSSPKLSAPSTRPAAPGAVVPLPPPQGDSSAPDSARAPVSSPPRRELAKAHASREPARAAPGYLTIVTVPWSNVFVDGARIGATPIVHRELPSGEHELLLENPEQHLSTKRTILIEPGQLLTRRLTLP